MSNKKVYLVKSPLASGFDVEYVKSNLLRIPNIKVIEYSSGVEVSKCAAVVYVHDADFDFDNLAETEEKLVIGKLATNTIDEFLDCGGDINNVYVYTGPSDEDSSLNGDAELTTPNAIYCDDFSRYDSPYDNEYGDLDAPFYNSVYLLECISNDVEEDGYAWKKYPRHYTPLPEYKMPEIPTVEERMTTKSAKFIAPEIQYVKSDRRACLSLRKKRK